MSSLAAELMACPKLKAKPSRNYFLRRLAEIRSAVRGRARGRYAPHNRRSSES